MILFPYTQLRWILFIYWSSPCFSIKYSSPHTPPLVCLIMSWFVFHDLQGRFLSLRSVHVYVSFYIIRCVVSVAHAHSRLTCSVCFVLRAVSIRLAAASPRSVRAVTMTVSRDSERRSRRTAASQAAFWLHTVCGH
jgi:hypothetical protein